MLPVSQCWVQLSELDHVMPLEVFGVFTGNPLGLGIGVVYSRRKWNVAVTTSDTLAPALVPLNNAMLEQQEAHDAYVHITLTAAVTGNRTTVRMYRQGMPYGDATNVPTVLAGSGPVTELQVYLGAAVPGPARAGYAQFPVSFDCSRVYATALDASRVDESFRGGCERASPLNLVRDPGFESEAGLGKGGLGAGWSLEATPSGALGHIAESNVTARQGQRYFHSGCGATHRTVQQTVRVPPGRLVLRYLAMSCREDCPADAVSDDGVGDGDTGIVTLGTLREVFVTEGSFSQDALGAWKQLSYQVDVAGGSELLVSFSARPNHCILIDDVALLVERAGDNLVLDGDFEHTRLADHQPQLEVPVGRSFGMNGGWVQSSAATARGVLYGSSVTNAFHRRQSFSLRGSECDVVAQGTISQTLATQPGATYSLQFYVRQDRPDGPNVFDINFGTLLGCDALPMVKPWQGWRCDVSVETAQTPMLVTVKHPHCVVVDVIRVAQLSQGTVNVVANHRFENPMLPLDMSSQNLPGGAVFSGAWRKTGVGGALVTFPRGASGVQSVRLANACGPELGGVEQRTATTAGGHYRIVLHAALAANTTQMATVSFGSLEARRFVPQKSAASDAAPFERFEFTAVAVSNETVLLIEGGCVLLDSVAVHMLEGVGGEDRLLRLFAGRWRVVAAEGEDAAWGRTVRVSSSGAVVPEGLDSLPGKGGVAPDQQQLLSSVGGGRYLLGPRRGAEQEEEYWHLNASAPDAFVVSRLGLRTFEAVASAFREPSCDPMQLPPRQAHHVLRCGGARLADLDADYPVAAGETCVVSCAPNYDGPVSTAHCRADGQANGGWVVPEMWGPCADQRQAVQNVVARWASSAALHPLHAIDSVLTSAWETTAGEGDAAGWIVFDLGRAHVVSRVDVFVPTAAHFSTMHTWSLASDSAHDGTFGTLLGTFLLPREEGWHRFEVMEPVAARFLRVRVHQNHGFAHTSLHEVAFRSHGPVGEVNSSEPATTAVTLAGMPDGCMAPSASEGTPPPVVDNLVAHWEFESLPCIAVDRAGHNHGVVVGGDVRLVPGSAPGSSALAIGPGSGCIHVARATWASRDYTLAALVKATEHNKTTPLPPWRNIVGQWPLGDADDVNIQWARLGMSPRGAFASGSAAADHQTAAEGRWTHVATTLASGILTLYVDGRPVATEERPVAQAGPRRQLHIGCLAPQRSMWHGLLERVLLYDRALSAKEIGRLALTPNGGAATTTHASTTHGATTTLTTTIAVPDTVASTEPQRSPAAGKTTSGEPTPASSQPTAHKSVAGTFVINTEPSPARLRPIAAIAAPIVAIALALLVTLGLRRRRGVAKVGFAAGLGGFVPVSLRSEPALPASH